MTRARALRLGAGTAVAGLLATVVWLRCGPLPAGLLDDEQQPSTVVVDRRGETLYEVRSASGLRSERGDGALPKRLADATVAAEDVRFFSHAGVDPIAIARASVHNIRAGRIVEGGSTITQQVASLLLAAKADGRQARGWFAKLHEAVVAIRLEHRLTKPAILALYLDLAPYGNQIQGVERAARAYFGRDASTLTAAEAAFLAALPQQPTRFNPWRDPTRATPRQRHILRVMAERGLLTNAEAASAQREQLALTREAPAMVAPHFVERVLAAAGRERPRRIRTTLDAGLQRAVQGIIEAERASLTRHHAANVAVAILDNRTGDWLAWEGSGNYADTTHGGRIDGVLSPRQPGSALKPFTYAAAFERGVTPARALADVPSQFPTAVPGVLYSPRNYDGQFRGPLLARAALAGSENVPAVALASEVGVPTIARLLRRAGLSTLGNDAAHYGLGLTLGNAEVRLDELVAAYAIFARGGDAIRTRMTLPESDAAVPTGTTESTERILSLRTAFWITDILSDSEARSYVFGRGGSLEFPFTVAAKTGTSQSYFDNWVVGYTRDVTVGVWVGNFDRTPLQGSSGVTGAGPIFHAVMLAAVEHVRGVLPIGSSDALIAPPPELHRHEICAVSGLAAGDACPTRAMEWLSDADASQRCTWHHQMDGGVLTVWPVELRDWARKEGLQVEPTMTTPIAVPVLARRGGGGSRVSPAIDRLKIARPLGGAVFSIDPTLRKEFQTLALAAQSRDAGVLDWFVDGEHVGQAPHDDAVRWPLARGRHVIVVRDARGASDRVTIEVR